MLGYPLIWIYNLWHILFYVLKIMLTSTIIYQQSFYLLYFSALKHYLLVLWFNTNTLKVIEWTCFCPDLEAVLVAGLEHRLKPNSSACFLCDSSPLCFGSLLKRVKQKYLLHRLVRKIKWVNIHELLRTMFATWSVLHTCSVNEEINLVTFKGLKVLLV